MLIRTLVSTNQVTLTNHATKTYLDSNTDGDMYTFKVHASKLECYGKSFQQFDMLF